MTTVAGSGGPRLLIYSQDGLGLGHLRRTTLLASEFLAGRPDGAVLTISDSPLGQFFTASHGHDYLKLPSVRKVAPGHWAPVSLPVPFDEVLALRKDAIRSAAAQFRPDVFLVDHMPHGAMGELLPTLEALEATSARKVLGLRDILDAPATIRRRWKLEGAFEAVQQHFDEVMVYGSSDVFDVAEEYAWPHSIRPKLRYCGYVCSPAPDPTASVRDRYLPADSAAELVVVMAGGGADGSTLFRAVLGAAQEVSADRPCCFVVVTGPFLPSEERSELQRRALGLPVLVLPQVTDALQHLASADLVVAMSGYNTTVEILQSGVRALIVPRSGPSAEQTMRASRFAERGWVSWLPSDELSSETLAAAILQTLDAPTPVLLARPDLAGRQRAALQLLESRDGRPAEERSADGLESATTVPASRLVGES